jgi:Trypsin-like peptidase domain
MTVTNEPKAQSAIARPSVASLMLETWASEVPLATATGFVVERSGTAYLITNFHVLAARHPHTLANLHPEGAWPDAVIVVHNGTQLGTWVGISEPVRNADGPLWLEHPKHRRKVNVVALPLTNTVGTQLFPYDLGGPADVFLGVTVNVSIVGFPFGQAGGGSFGIWAQGTVATEPIVDFNELPCFLVDSRTRPGQSGSPVIFYSAGGMIAMANGDSAVFGGPVERLLGVYSGRINGQSDLGFVWRKEVLAEIIDGGARGDDT